MTVRERLQQYYQDKGLEAPDGWFGVVLRGKRYRLFPQGPLKPLFTLHDLHHIVTGYETSLAGEAQIVAWEIASGGFRRYWFAWMDVAKILLFALLFPARFRAGWRRGRHASNLYGQELDALLDFEWSELMVLVETTEPR